MSTRMFQSVISQMKEASDRTMGIIDSEGNVVAATDPSCLGEKLEDAVHRLNTANETVSVSGGKTFKALSTWTSRFDYAAFVSGEDEQARSLCIMACVALNGAKISYEEKHDRGTFV